MQTTICNRYNNLEEEQLFNSQNAQVRAVQTDYVKPLLDIAQTILDKSQVVILEGHRTVGCQTTKNLWTNYCSSSSESGTRDQASQHIFAKVHRGIQCRVPLPFDKVKRIRQKEKDIVFGYLRKFQAMVHMKEGIVCSNIPKSIQYSILLFFYSDIESKILTDAETDDLLFLFEEQHKFKELKNYSFHLLYASYRDGIGEKIFKKICHDQQHLLCLIHAKEGNVFGGYTSKGWRGIHVGQAQDDEKAFLFLIRSKKGHDPKLFNNRGTDRELYNQRGFYCMFGSYCAFWIYDGGRKGSSYGQSHQYERMKTHDLLVGGLSLFCCLFGGVSAKIEI